MECVREYPYCSGLYWLIDWQRRCCFIVPSILLLKNSFLRSSVEGMEIFTSYFYLIIYVLYIYIYIYNLISILCITELAPQFMAHWIVCCGETLHVAHIVLELLKSKVRSIGGSVSFSCPKSKFVSGFFVSTFSLRRKPLFFFERNDT